MLLSPRPTAKHRTKIAPVAVALVAAADMAVVTADVAAEDAEAMEDAVLAMLALMCHLIQTTTPPTSMVIPLIMTTLPPTLSLLVTCALQNMFSYRVPLYLGVGYFSIVVPPSTSFATRRFYTISSKPNTPSKCIVTPAKCH